MYRIEVITTVFDARAHNRLNRFYNLGFRSIKKLDVRDVYTIDKKFPHKSLSKIAGAICNPVTQNAYILIEKDTGNNSGTFDWAVETGYLPGVTDNVAATTRELIEDLLKLKFSKGEGVYSSQLLLIKGKLNDTEIKKLSETLYNPIIQRIHIKSYRGYQKDG